MLEKTSVIVFQVVFQLFHWRLAEIGFINLPLLICFGQIVAVLSVQIPASFSPHFPPKSKT